MCSSLSEGKIPTYELSPKRMEFKLRGLKRSDFNELIKFVDYVGYDRSRRLSIYRLNVDKCVKEGLLQAISTLNKHGVKLSTALKNFLKKSRRPVVITLKGGDLIIYGNLPKNDLFLWSKEDKTLRAMPMMYDKILQHLKREGYDVLSDVNTSWNLPYELELKAKLRDYQIKAFERWVKNGYRGVIVLPTGSGKTYVALKAISSLNLKSLIVVPTIDLLNQWKDTIVENLNIKKSDVGIFGGGKKEIKPITVITYDSAYLNVERLGDVYGLLIFDECHHLPSRYYRKIAECSISWMRMGLTATPERSDGLHTYLKELIGDVVYRLSPRELSKGGYIANYSIERYYVNLSKEEEEEYRRLMKEYNDYVRKMFPSHDPRRAFELVVMRSRRDPSAHRALLCREKARKIALNARRKIEFLEGLLKRYREKKVIIFSRYNSIVREISYRFLIPKITHKTPEEERKMLIEEFRKGNLTKIVTGEVLDEGVDVPDASVGIIISGTGSERQFIQRLGRILRPKDEKATLIELVTRSTIDKNLSFRRRPKD
ncbi:MAG: DEAD/DEAH box helicase [Candidatus Asgardarchaeia archaeon]